MYSVFKNGPTSASFSFIFGLSKQTIQYLQQINVKNVLSVYGIGIRTHNLSNMSRHPQPLDQGYCNYYAMLKFV